MRRWTVWILALAALVRFPGAGASQEVQESLQVPTALAVEILEVVNDPGTVRLQGDARIPFGRRIQGPVALVAGRLVLDGEVDGDLVVFNGDLVLGPAALVTGDVVVVGGDLELAPGGRLQGLALVYDRAFPLALQEGKWVPRGELGWDRPSLVLGGSRFTVRAGRGYNRVEGLPILFGPTIRSPGEFPLRFDAQAIFRTAALNTEELGYIIRLEQSFGGPARPRIGLSAYSEVQTVEDRGLSDLESSLAAFLFRRDLRDHFQNTGWSAYLEMQRVDFPVSLRFSYRDESHFPVAPRDPLVLFRRDAEWRLMPLAGQGDLTSLALDARLDTRNNPENPTDGWLLEGSLVRGLDGGLEIPGYAALPEGPASPGSAFAADGIFVGSLDIRRYTRVDPDSDLRLRLNVGGSLGGDPLPPQFQRSLGGAGTLPGYRRFLLDCGARDAVVYTEDDEGTVRGTYPAYGCDQTVLFQAQYREEFSIGLDLSPDDGDWDDWRWWPDVDLSLAWVLFMDAGRGWSLGPDGRDTSTLLDAGFGLQLGDLGAYLAYPFEGEDRKVRFNLRLQHRF